MKNTEKGKNGNVSWREQQLTLKMRGRLLSNTDSPKVLRKKLSLGNKRKE